MRRCGEGDCCRTQISHAHGPDQTLLEAASFALPKSWHDFAWPINLCHQRVTMCESWSACVRGKAGMQGHCLTTQLSGRQSQPATTCMRGDTPKVETTHVFCLLQRKAAHTHKREPPSFTPSAQKPAPSIQISSSHQQRCMRNSATKVNSPNTPTLTASKLRAPPGNQSSQG